ncbi:MAG: hypothetical protein WCK42_09300 [Myxococcaceae bacterium]
MILVSLAHAELSPLEFQTPDEKTVVEYCPPAGKVYQNYRLHNGTLVTRPLYASELLEITEEEEPPYYISYQFSHIKFAKFFSLADLNDFCDRTGALYMAKHFVRLWPGTDGFFELSEIDRLGLLKLLQLNDIERPSVLENARIEARNIIRQKYSMNSQQ